MGEYLEKYCEQQRRLCHSSKYGCQVLNTSTELVGYKDELHHRLNPLTDRLVKVESTLTDILDSFQETQQATSYNGQLSWKIDVSRRLHEANSEVHGSYSKVN